jgi:hypothetical protein
VPVRQGSALGRSCPLASTRRIGPCAGAVLNGR